MLGESDRADAGRPRSGGSRAAARVLPALPFNLNFGAESIPLLGFPLSSEFYFTNQLLMTLVAAGLCLLIFPRLARAYAAGGPEPPPPRGLFMNFFEALLQFIREEVARPVLKHRTDRFMPFLWTLFFFILFCNVLGMVPLADIDPVAHRRQAPPRRRHRDRQYRHHRRIGRLRLPDVPRQRRARSLRGPDVRNLRPPPRRGARDARRAPRRWRAYRRARAAVAALPLYIWNFAPHVFAKTGARPRPRAVGQASGALFSRGVTIALPRGIASCNRIRRDPSTMNNSALAAAVARHWNDSIVPQLVEYVRIPAKSPHFDPQWEAHGHIETVIRLAEAWVRQQPVRGLHGRDRAPARAARRCCISTCPDDGRSARCCCTATSTSSRR